MNKIRSILIVDDMRIDQLNARYIITGYDKSIEILSAYDGQEALDILAEQPEAPDIILLDINMPRMNGLSFLKTYQDSASEKTVIAILSSSDQPCDKEECNTYPFVKEFISKPLEMKEIEALAEYL